MVKAEGFFVGVYATLSETDEILTQIRIPIPAAGSGWSYAKFKRKTGDFATAAAAVLLQMKGGKVAKVAIALTNVGPTPIKASKAEQHLVGKADRRREPQRSGAPGDGRVFADPLPARLTGLQDRDGRRDDATRAAERARARQTLSSQR